MTKKNLVRTSAAWTTLFQKNAGNRDFGLETRQLTPPERAAITRSLQEFQLGETGEGSHITRQASIHAQRDGDPEYLIALRLFIAEEIRHSRELKSFMEGHGIPVLKKTPADSLFRFARRLAGLELSIAVLVGAEIVAKVYYAALARATGSQLLAKICTQILKDEVDHVQFQCERLAILRRNLGPVALAWRMAAYHLLFRATLLLVWWQHGRAMRSGKYGFPRFYRHAIAELHAAIATMNPKNYAWQSPPNPAPGFLAGRIRSVCCALAGLLHLVRSQRNAWVHAAATAAVIASASALRLTTNDWCWLVAAITAVWMAEALNTALELVCDATSPQADPLIGKAKDVAAGGVLLASCAAAAIGLAILGPHLFAPHLAMAR